MRSVDKMTMKSAGAKTNVDRLSAFGGEERIFTKLLASCFVLALSLLFCRSVSAQQTTSNVTNRDGEVVFQLDFYGGGQGSTGDFSNAQIAAITEAAEYWVDILKSHGTMPEKLDADGKVILDADGNAEHQPVVFSIYYDAGIVGNASAGTNGYHQSKDGYNLSLPEALMVDGVYVDPNKTGGHASINVGSGWNAVSGNQSQSGRVNNDLTPVLVHEMGHALGIASSATYEIDEYIPYDITWHFKETVSRYDSHLRDNNGNSPLTGPLQNEGKTIGYDETGGKNANTIFDIGDPNSPLNVGEGDGNPSRVTFVGKNTLELWYGKNYNDITDVEKRYGVPIQGYTYGASWEYPYRTQWTYNPGGTLSHINTTNSLMSWQAYRNYPGFIEIELAVMQDIGYSVERRNFFGKSFYVDGDGESIFYNSSAFSYWDAKTQSYDASKANDATYAIGAHLFANNLNIFQNGDIWVKGAGSAGVRIDGSSNDFTLMSSTTVLADQWIEKDANGNITKEVNNNIGILVAYGKDHNVTLQKGSTVKALGELGYAVSFDFGASLFGDVRHSYYYGYITTQTGGTLLDIGYLPELYGPLVSEFNVSGKIVGGTYGSGAPVVRQGSDDRIITRGNDLRFTEDTYATDIIRLFENGGLTLPPPVLNADDSGVTIDDSVVNEALSTVIVNRKDGSTVIIHENTDPLVTAPILFDKDAYKVRRVDSVDSGSTVVQSTFYLTHLTDDTQIVVVVDRVTGEDGKAAYRITSTISDEFEDQYAVYEGYAEGDATTVYDPANPDVTIVFRKESGDGTYYLERVNAGDTRDGAIVHGLLDNYDLTYSEDGRLFVLRKEDDPNYDPTKPWTRYVTADQDSVEIPFGGAAVYIDSTAHVEQINIMQGASIEGDIISRYRDEEDRGTTITFGLKADGSGKATSAVDGDFKFVYKDNINYYEYFERAYINDRPGYDDIARWGAYDYDEKIGAYVYVGENQGRYAKIEGDAFNLENIGKIDLHFVGGYTEFQANRSIVDSVVIDYGATFSFGAASSYNETTGVTNTVTPSMYVFEDFQNNGRFSGVGSLWVGTIQMLDSTAVDDGGTIQGNTIGYIGTGTFYNNGTIAPGGKNGEGVGIITIDGDLEFGKNSTYEVTIGGKSETRYHSGVLPNGNFVDPSGIMRYQFDYLDAETLSVVVESVDLLRPNTTPIQGTGNDVIVVSGNTKMDGTLKVNVLADSVFGNETTTHTIIQSGTFTEGSNFKKIEYDQRFLAITDVVISSRNTHEAQITVVRELDFFQKRGKTHNEIAVGKAVDNSLFHDPRIAFSLGHKLSSDTDVRDMLRQIGASVRANSAMLSLWNPAELVFNRIGYGNGQMNTDDRGRVNWDRISGRSRRMLGQSPYSRRSGSVWGDAIHTTFDTESDGNSDDYKFSRTGFMFGGEWNLGMYSAVGAIASYTDGSLKQGGDKVESDDYMLGLYFVCAPFNEFEIKSYIGLGFQEYTMNRYVRNANIVHDGGKGINDRYLSDAKGNSFNFSFELARPLMLHPTFVLRPTIGIDIQHVWQNGFAENSFKTTPDSFGSNLYALRFSKMHYDRALLRAGFSSETSGVRGGIQMRAFYVTNFGDENYPTSTAAFKTGGEKFSVRGVDLGKNYLNLGIGANLWIDGEKTSSLFFDYDSDIYMSSRKTYNHSISAGFIQNF